MKKKILSVAFLAFGLVLNAQNLRTGDLNSTNSQGFEGHLSTGLSYSGSVFTYEGSNDWNHFNSILMGDGRFSFVGYQGWGQPSGLGSSFSANELIQNHSLMTLDYQGNLGLGIVNPAAKLDILIDSNNPYSRGWQVSNNLNQIFLDFAIQDGHNNSLVLGGDYSILWNNYNSNEISQALVIGPKNGAGLRINANGFVGVGTTYDGDDDGFFKFGVKGGIVCEELRVDLQGAWPDYVFQKDYNLRSLDDLQLAIDTLGHLPGLPSQDELSKGVDIGEMTRIQMEKIEELTLYMLQLKKENDTLKALIQSYSNH